MRQSRAFTSLQLGILTLVLFGCALSSFHLPLLSHEPGLHGDFGDTRLVIMFLEHTFQYLSSDWIPSYWATPWNFFPFSMTLAMSEPMSGNAFIYVPLRLMGMQPEYAAKWWFILTSLLNFGSAILLFRSLGAKPIAALAAAYLVSFSMIRLNYMNHPHLFPNYPANFAIYFLITSMQVSNLKYQMALGAMAGLSMALQFWCSLHLGWFACFGVFLVIAIGFLSPTRSQLTTIVKSQWRGLAAGCIAFLLLFWPLFRALMAFKALNHHPRGFDEVRIFMLNSSSYLMPSASTSIYQWLFERVAPTLKIANEKSAFMGLVPLFITLGSLLWIPVLPNADKESRYRIVTRISGLVFLFLLLVCTRDIFGETSWQVFHRYFPGADGVRAIGRISLLQMFLMAIIVSYFISYFESEGKRLVCLLVLGVLVLENFAPAQEKFLIRDHRSQIADFDARVRQNCNGSYAHLFYRKAPENPFERTLAMWYALENKKNLINGYSGFSPPEFSLNRESTVEQIQQWFVVNGQTLEPSQLCIVQ